MNEFHIGDKIKFAEERLSYTVRATSQRFAVCTKPFNPRKTVLYTIVDFEQKIRGTENLIFNMGFETNEQCNRALTRLVNGESEISHRNRISMKIDKIVRYV